MDSYEYRSQLPIVDGPGGTLSIVDRWGGTLDRERFVYVVAFFGTGGGTLFYPWQSWGASRVFPPKPLPSSGPQFPLLHRVSPRVPRAPPACGAVCVAL